MFRRSLRILKKKMFEIGLLTECFCNMTWFSNKNCNLSLARPWLAYHAKCIVSPVVLLLFFFYQLMTPVVTIYQVCTMKQENWAKPQCLVLWLVTIYQASSRKQENWAKPKCLVLWLVSIYQVSTMKQENWARPQCLVMWLVTICNSTTKYSIISLWWYLI